MNQHQRTWICRGALALLVIYWLALGMGTHLPHHTSGSLSHGDDKLLHFGAYLGLALLLCLAVATQRVLSWKLLLGLYLVVIAYGLFDELLQIPIAGRYAEANDWIADCLGAAVGMGLFVCTRKLIPKRTLPQPEADL